MAVYRNCSNCALASFPCSRREEIRAVIKSAGITSVKFRCQDRLAIYQPGQRVSITWPVYDDEDLGPESWPATIIEEVGTRFLILVDDVDSSHGTPAREYVKNERLFAKVSAAKLKPINEPARVICKFCGLTPSLGDACKETGWAPASPPNCVIAMRPLEAA